MNLDIMKAVISRGFSEEEIKSTLKNKFIKTNVEFFTLEPTTDAIVKFIKDEARTVNLQEAEKVQTVHSTLLDDPFSEYLPNGHLKHGMF